MKVLVLFAFHDHNERVKHLFKTIFFEDKDTDFVVISNNKECLIEVPPYVTVIRRENVGFDFGAWSEGLLTDARYKSYDRFIFLNSSVIGPFYPHGYTGKWTDLFLNGLQGPVKLFGCTINTCKNPLHFSHLQSYAFAIDKTTLELLIESSLFSLTNHARSYHEVVWNKEVLMSRLVLQQGWNIGSFMNYYKDVDFTFKTKRPEEYKIEFLDDIMFEQFHNKVWNKREIVFLKGNRLPNNGFSLD